MQGKIKNEDNYFFRCNILTEDWKTRDCIFFFLLIPILLISTYLLPESLKEFLILHTSAPTTISLFSAHYVHSGLPHLLGNIVGYCTIVGTIFNIETNRKEFLKIATLIFGGIPFIVSLVEIIIWEGVYLQGFSAIVSAFLGYLVYSTYGHIRKYYDPSLKLNFFYVVLLINLLLISCKLAMNSGILPGMGLLILSIFYCERGEINKILEQTFLAEAFFPGTKPVYEHRYESYYCTVVWLLAAALMFYLPRAVELENTTGIMPPGTIAHFAGYISGLLCPFALNSLKSTREKRDKEKRGELERGGEKRKRAGSLRLPFKIIFSQVPLSVHLPGSRHS